MPTLALALLLAAALGHATWNYYAKGARNDLAFTFAVVACSSTLYLPVAAGVLLVGDPKVTAAGVGFVGASACLHMAYYFLLTQGYRSGDLSLVYPLARGTGPALAVAGAVILFGERPSALAVAGTALIVGGILVMSWPRGTDATKAVGVSVAFALATGACTALYTLWDKEGVDRLAPLLYGFGLEASRAAMLAPFALATAAGRRAVSDAWNEQRRAVFAIALLSPAAYVLVLAALRIAPVSHVAPAREVSILFGALLGLRLLGEPEASRRIAGATAIVAGVFALALG